MNKFLYKHPFVFLTLLMGFIILGAVAYTTFTEPVNIPQPTGVKTQSLIANNEDRFSSNIPDPAEDYSPAPLNMDQGAYQLPTWFLANLIDPQSQKSLLDMMPSFGFIFDQNQFSYPPGLPIGLTAVETSFPLLGKVEYSSMNCAVCHTGQLDINGKSYVLLGAANKFNTTAWAFFVKETVESCTSDYKSLVKLYLKSRKENALPSLTSQEPLSANDEQLLASLALTPNESTAPNDGSSSLSTLQTQRKAEGTHQQRILENALGELNSSLLKQTPTELLNRETNNKDDESRINEINLDKILELATREENQLSESQGPNLSSQLQTFSPLDEIPIDEAYQKKLEARNKEALAVYKKHIPSLLALLLHYKKFQDAVIPVVNRVGPAGPGRDDAWSILAAYVGNVPSDESPPPSFVKIPPLFPYAFYSQTASKPGSEELPLYKFHCDGNTTSFMERNLLQAMAIGALRNGDTTLADLEAIHLSELRSRELKIPNFPDLKLPFDQALADKGKILFESKVHPYENRMESCASCHSHPEGKAYDLHEIGTDPRRYEFFNSPYAKEYKILKRIAESVKKIKLATIKSRPENFPSQLKYEPVGASWSNNSGGYIARPLYGAWTSAPYLHNGTVRTITELLTPPSKREPYFFTGTRNYDIENLGYFSEEFYSPAPDINTEAYKLSCFDPATNTYSNLGHDYGTQWSPEEKKAVIEYLKTMTPPK